MSNATGGLKATAVSFFKISYLSLSLSIAWFQRTNASVPNPTPSSSCAFLLQQQRKQDKICCEVRPWQTRPCQQWQRQRQRQRQCVLRFSNRGLGRIQRIVVRGLLSFKQFLWTCRNCRTRTLLGCSRFRLPLVRWSSFTSLIWRAF